MEVRWMEGWRDEINEITYKSVVEFLLSRCQSIPNVVFASFGTTPLLHVLGSTAHATVAEQIATPARP